MARKGKIEIGASVTVGAKEDGSLSKIEKRIEKLSNEEIEINIKDAAKHLKELEKMEKTLGKNMAGSIEAQKKQFTDLIEQCKQEQKLRAENLKQIEQEVKTAKELQKIEEKTAKIQKQKTNGPTKREQELTSITKSVKGIRGVVNTFDDPKIQKTEEKVRKLIDALDEYQTKLDAMKRLRKGNERTMYDTAKSEIADLKRALGAIQAIKDQTPSIKSKIEKKEKEVEQEKPKKTTSQKPNAPVVGAGDSAKSIQEQTMKIERQTSSMKKLGNAAKQTAQAKEQETTAIHASTQAVEENIKAKKKQIDLQKAYLDTRKIYEVRNGENINFFPTKEKAEASVKALRLLGFEAEVTSKKLNELNQEQRESFENMYYKPSAVYKPGRDFELKDGDLGVYMAMIEGREDFASQYNRLHKLHISGATSAKIRPNQNMLDIFSSMLNESDEISEQEIELLERLLTQRLSDEDRLKGLLEQGRADIEGKIVKADPNSTWADMARYYDGEISQIGQTTQQQERLTSTVKENIAEVEKLQALLSDLKKKYGEGGFEYFADTINSFGTLNASNAIKLYDVLIEKEKEYIAHLEEERQKRAAIVRESQLFMTNSKVQDILFKNQDNEDFIQGIYTGILEKITQGALTANEAVRGLEKSLETITVPTDIEQQVSAIETLTQANNNLVNSYLKVQEAAKRSAQQIRRQAAATNSVASQNNKNITFGSSGETDANGRAISFKYAVMSVDNLTMSHNAYGQKNPNYPTELQPRDRSRMISVDQISKIAQKINPALLTSSPTAQNGSPIVSKDGIVIGGNARSAALAKAYETGQADAYRTYIKEHASEFGLDPNNMPNNPVLVRVLDIEDNLDVLARQLNESTNAGYSATEQAFALVESVMRVISKLNLDESANLNSQVNRDFISSLINLLPDNLKNEMVTKDTELSAVGVAKVKQALMAAAYDSKVMLENLEQVSPELVNISNALMASAAKAADIRHSVESGTLNDLGVISTILNGVDLLKASRGKGQTIGEYLDQMSMFGQDYTAEDVAIGKFFEANVRNTAQLRNMIDTILDFARNAGDPNQISFDGIKDITLADVIRNAFIKHAEAYQKNINYDELSDGFLPAEPGSRSDKRAISQRRIIEQQTEPPVASVQLSVVPGTVEDAIQESTGGDKIEVPVKPVVDEKEAKERLSIIERNEDKALEALRNAKDNKTNLVDLSNVYSTDDLKGQLESMAQQITDNEKIPLSVGDVKISDSIAAVTMYNEALGITYRQLYKISEAADDASESQLELWSESYDENYKAAQKYSEAQKKKIEKDNSWLISQASKLDTQERKYKYSNKTIDGKTVLTDADETSLAEGADKTIDSLAEHIKNRIQASMGQGLTDEVRNQITNDLRILDNEIKIEQYKQYASTTMKPTELKAAKDELEYTLQSLEAKAKKSNVFSQIEQDVIDLRSQLKSVADGTQLSSFIDNLRVAKSKLNAEISKEQTTKKEEQNYQNLINLQNRLYEAKKKLNDLEIKGQLDTVEGQQASRKVQDLQDQYDLSVKLLQNEENRKAIEERGSNLESEMNTAKNQKQIEQYYQNIFDTVQRINNLDSQINALKFKDSGKGIYSDLIASLESEKSILLNKIDQISTNIYQYFNGAFASIGGKDSIQLPFDTLLKDTNSYSTILNFLNDVGVRANLSAEQINKLVQAFYNSSQAGSEFVSKINEQFKSAEEAFNRLEQLVSSGYLDKNNAEYQKIKNYFSILQKANETDKSKWTSEGIAYFTELSKSVTKYSNDLSKAIEQEAQYFAGKTKARSGITIFNDDGGKSALVKKDQAGAGYGDNIDSARQKLEAFVQEYTKGQGIVTSFNTAANGISKVDFSVFDEATGKIRTFTAEVGKLNNEDVFYSETSMKNLVAGTDAAMKSLESISQTITRLQDIKGAESEIEKLKQLAAELRDKLIEIGSSKESSDQNMLKNIATDADNAVKSANKLGEALLKVQRAINGESSKDFNINSVNKYIDSIDQMIAKLKQIDGTESVVSKLREQLIKIKSALSAPDINTSDGQTKLKSLLTDTEKLIKSVNVLEKQWTKAQDAMDNGNGKNLGQINKNGDIYAQMLNKVQEAANGAQVTVTGFDQTTNTLTYTLTNADGTVTTMTAHMHNLNGVVTTQQGETKKLASGWQEFAGGIKGAIKNLAQYAGRMFSVWAVVAQLKKGFSEVKEIDASLTELKKVTDETEASYKNFLNTASQTAGKIGSTVSDFTTASANFARLGYTMEESAKMAETAIVYKNVADGLDTVEESTESIISTMKAFGIESSDTMGIIDRFNEVGNNFAITSAGIGEALQRSASALYEAGNTIDESIGLVTAANSVIQNPEQVGTALKTEFCLYVQKCA